MEEKLLNKRIERLKFLIKKLKSWDIGYSELFELKDLLIKINAFTEEEFQDLLNKDEFSTLSKLFDYIYDEDSKKTKTSLLFATIAGRVTHIEFNLRRNLI